ncbi:hypothetical protein [Roseibium alexandrii]|uniref:ASCH domain-containing protein n=1 Tax=Roseibium alexandrii TaxID=388408 RepID=A0A0M6ZYD4_9HYPH|nr:hypothetical protein [Roseibium alexandrii]CTQ67216.1 hypothetical protein LAX5112_01272 [Roseibium alexandrii]
MTIRPIIFSGPMIRALLEGRKTQTRRVLSNMDGVKEVRRPDRATWDFVYPKGYKNPKASPPNYAVGDLLYVRESFALSETGFAFMADHPGDTSGMGWKPSIHMPREASRLTLKVTDVRVQRVQETTQDDVLAEGAPIDPDYRDTTQDLSAPPMIKTGVAQWQSPRAWFHRLWDSLNEKRGYGWNKNPWVIALTFEVHHCNVDQFNREVAA